MCSSVWRVLVSILLIGCTPTSTPAPVPIPVSLSSLVPIAPPQSQIQSRVDVVPSKNNSPIPGSQRYQRSLTREARAVYGLNAPIATFAAQIHQESGWDATAVSYVGATGMAQFMPKTAKGISEDFPELGPASPTDPEWSMRAMVRYMKQINDGLTAADECSLHAFALSGYNGGPGWVLRDKRLAKTAGLDPEIWWSNVELVNAGRSAAAFKENRGYPQRIIKNIQSRYASWGRGVCSF